MQPKLFIATKAFIVRDGKVLLVRESAKYRDGANIGKYDVVGGRIAAGERFDESLLREIKEETGLTTSIGRPFFVNEWRPTVRGELWQIVGVFFECSAESQAVVLGEDHDDYRWIDPREYRNYQLIENLAPAFKTYLSFTELAG